MNKVNLYHQLVNKGNFHQPINKGKLYHEQINKGNL